MITPEKGGPAMFSPSLLFPAGCEEHHYLQNRKRTTQSILVFYLLLFCRSASPLFQAAGTLSQELMLEAEMKGEPVRSVMDQRKLKRPTRRETPSGAGKKAERGLVGATPGFG